MLSLGQIVETRQNPLDPTPQALRSVEGIDKLRRSIAKELKNGESGGFDEKCSNLPQLISVLRCIVGREKTGCKPSAVLKPFNYTKGCTTARFIVDIVSRDRDEWFKVSARNPKSLSLLAAGGGGFGQRSIIDHARDYILCSQQNHSFFKPPTVTFVFTSGIGYSLAQELKSMGINIEGQIILDSELAIRPRITAIIESNPENMLVGQTFESQIEVTHKSFPSLEGIKRLNLDITALLAFVSNLTNGHTDVQFKTEILKQQLQFEKIRPQKEVLDKIFYGREICCCQTAMLEFKSILSTVGGLQEKQRAAEFLKGITVVPDQMSLRSKSLALTGNVKQRSLIIFGTGDSIEAVTVTANSGFVRSALSQGIEFPVFLHESRALTEGKENLTRI